MRYLFLILFFVSSAVYADFEITAGSGTTINTGAGNVASGTQRLTIATDDVNLAAIKTATELLDNTVSGSELQVDVVTSALPTGAATAANQSTANSSLSTIATNTADTEFSFATSNGTAITTATTTTAIAAPGASTCIRVYKLRAANSSATAVKVGFKENSGSLIVEETLTQYQPLSFSLDSNYIELTANTAFEIVTSAAGNVTYTVLYTTASC